MILGHGQRRKRKKKALLSISGVAELAASAVVLLLLAALLLLLLSSTSSEEKEAATEAEASPFFIDRGRGGTLDDERRRGTNFCFQFPLHAWAHNICIARHIRPSLPEALQFREKELTFFSLPLQSSPPFNDRDRIREALTSGPPLPPRPLLLRPAPVPSGATRGFTSDSPADTGTEGGGGEGGGGGERSNRKLTSGGQDCTGGHRCKKQTVWSEKSYAVKLMFLSSEA